MIIFFLVVICHPRYIGLNRRKSSCLSLTLRRNVNLENIILVKKKELEILKVLLLSYFVRQSDFCLWARIKCALSCNKLILIA